MIASMIARYATACFMNLVQLYHILPYLDKESIALAAKVENTKLEEATEMMFIYEDDQDTDESADVDSVHEEVTVVPEEVGEPRVDHVLRKINEKIALLETEGDKITKEIARFTILFLSRIQMHRTLTITWPAVILTG
ncbi:hypothetical protein ACH5RR_028415 [Cinchona calisaya]|uniref:Uncharacterized protein n=1 Tax=Cinchona calisaya TaxID=153742 RepID=A0ABD2YQN4_9GENT